MKAGQEKRGRKITIRFTDKECKKVIESFKKTTKRKLSEFIRSVLLDRPVTVYTRNQSIDNLIEELTLLKRELSAIGSNFNQLVKRLHTAARIAEIKSLTIASEAQQKQFLEKTKEINGKIQEIAEKWLQE